MTKKQTDSKRLMDLACDIFLFDGSWKTVRKADSVNRSR